MDGYNTIFSVNNLQDSFDIEKRLNNQTILIDPF